MQWYTDSVILTDIRLVFWLALKWVLKCAQKCSDYIHYFNPIYIINERQRHLYGPRDERGKLHSQPTLMRQLIDFFISDATHRRRLLFWAQQHVPHMRVDDFSTCWRDGVALCGLVEGVWPGAIPRCDLLQQHHRVNNCRLGLRIAQRNLGLTQPIIIPEEMAIADEYSEDKIRQLLTLLKWASRSRREGSPRTVSGDPGTCTHPAKSGLADEMMMITTNQAVLVQGAGLREAVVSRNATFYIHTGKQVPLEQQQIGMQPISDLRINIRGPKNEMCSERIMGLRGGSSISQEDVTNNSWSGWSNDSWKQNSMDIPIYYQYVSHGRYAVTYVPLNSGKHHVNITWHGEHVDGSPHSLTVKPTSLGGANVNTLKHSSVDHKHDNSISTHRKGRRLSVTMRHAQKVEVGESRDKSQVEFANTVTTPDMTYPAASTSQGYPVTPAEHGSLNRQCTITRRRVVKQVLLRGGQELSLGLQCRGVSLISRQSGQSSMESNHFAETSDGYGTSSSGPSSNKDRNSPNKRQLNMPNQIERETTSSTDDSKEWLASIKNQKNGSNRGKISHSLEDRPSSTDLFADKMAGTVILSAYDQVNRKYSRQECIDLPDTPPSKEARGNSDLDTSDDIGILDKSARPQRKQNNRPRASREEKSSNTRNDIISMFDVVRELQTVAKNNGIQDGNKGVRKHGYSRSSALIQPQNTLMSNDDTTEVNSKEPTTSCDPNTTSTSHSDYVSTSSVSSDVTRETQTHAKKKAASQFIHKFQSQSADVVESQEESLDYPPMTHLPVRTAFSEPKLRVDKLHTKPPKIYYDCVSPLTVPDNGTGPTTVQDGTTHIPSVKVVDAQTNVESLAVIDSGSINAESVIVMAELHGTDFGNESDLKDRSLIDSDNLTNILGNLNPQFRLRRVSLTRQKGLSKTSEDSISGSDGKGARISDSISGSDGKCVRISDSISGSDGKGARISSDSSSTDDLENRSAKRSVRLHGIPISFTNSPKAEKATIHIHAGFNEIQIFIPTPKTDKWTQVSYEEIKQATGWVSPRSFIRRRKHYVYSDHETKRPNTPVAITQTPLIPMSIPTVIVPRIVYEHSDIDEDELAEEFGAGMKWPPSRKHIGSRRRYKDIEKWLRDSAESFNDELRPARQSTVDTIDSGIAESRASSPGKHDMSGRLSVRPQVSLSSDYQDSGSPKTVNNHHTNDTPIQPDSRGWILDGAGSDTHSPDTHGGTDGTCTVDDNGTRINAKSSTEVLNLIAQSQTDTHIITDDIQRTTSCINEPHHRPIQTLEPTPVKIEAQMQRVRSIPETGLHRPTFGILETQTSGSLSDGNIKYANTYISRPKSRQKAFKHSRKQLTEPELPHSKSPEQYQTAKQRRKNLLKSRSHPHQKLWQDEHSGDEQFYNSSVDQSLTSGSMALQYDSSTQLSGSMALQYDSSTQLLDDITAQDTADVCQRVSPPQLHEHADNGHGRWWNLPEAIGAFQSVLTDATESSGSRHPVGRRGLSTDLTSDTSDVETDDPQSSDSELDEHASSSVATNNKDDVIPEINFRAFEHALVDENQTSSQFVDQAYFATTDSSVLTRSRMIERRYISLDSLSEKHIGLENSDTRLKQLFHSRSVDESTLRYNLTSVTHAHLFTNPVVSDLRDSQIADNFANTNSDNLLRDRDTTPDDDGVSPLSSVHYVRPTSSEQCVDDIVSIPTSQPDVDSVLGIPSSHPGVDGVMGIPSSHPGVDGVAAIPSLQPGVDGVVGIPSSQPGVDSVLGIPSSQPGVDGVLGIPSSQPVVDGVLGIPSSQLGVDGILGIFSSHPGVDGVLGIPSSQPVVDGVQGIPSSQLGVDGVAAIPSLQPGVDGVVGIPSSQPGLDGVMGIPSSQSGIDGIVGIPSSQPGVDGAVSLPSSQPCANGSFKLLAASTLPLHSHLKYDDSEIFDPLQSQRLDAHDGRKQRALDDWQKQRAPDAEQKQIAPDDEQKQRAPDDEQKQRAPRDFKTNWKTLRRGLLGKPDLPMPEVSSLQTAVILDDVLEGGSHANTRTSSIDSSGSYREMRDTLSELPVWTNDKLAERTKDTFFRDKSWSEVNSSPVDEQTEQSLTVWKSLRRGLKRQKGGLLNVSILLAEEEFSSLSLSVAPNKPAALKDTGYIQNMRHGSSASKENISPRHNTLDTAIEQRYIGDEPLSFAKSELCEEQSLVSHEHVLDNRQTKSLRGVLRKQSGIEKPICDSDLNEDTVSPREQNDTKNDDSLESIQRLRKRRSLEESLPLLHPAIDSDGEDGGDIMTFLQTLDRLIEGEHTVSESTADHNRNTSCDPLACRAFGPGLSRGYVGVRNSFQVRTDGAGSGSLSAVVRGSHPRNIVETSVLYTGDNIYDITYEVSWPGYYVISVTWASFSIFDSPFVCKVVVLDGS